MTPEERNKIYEEEKERLKAQEKLKEEEQKKKTKKTVRGCGVLFLVVIIISLILVFSGGKEDTIQKEVRYCNNNGVNIRTGPGTSYALDESGKLLKGEKLYVLGSTQFWIRFCVNPKDTSWSGWVKKDLTISKAQWDLNRFTAEINKLQRDMGANLVKDVSISQNKATITVTNLWHLRNKQIRLQDAQTLWELWAKINSPSKPDESFLKLVDFNGNKVGGSKYAGSTINVK